MGDLKGERELRRKALATDELAQAHGDVVAAAWRTDDPHLAERFSEAMKKACAEYPEDFSAALRSAWTSDPELRARFGEAVTAGLRKMWADPAARRLLRAHQTNL